MATDSTTQVCIEPDCSKKFTINSGEMDFYVQRGIELPKRCKTCRTARKNGKVATAPIPEPEIEKAVEITCDNCGSESTVPFRPIPNKPVYCKLCWEGIKNVVTIPNIETYN